MYRWARYWPPNGTFTLPRPRGGGYGRGGLRPIARVGVGYAMAGLARCASLSAALRTAVSICCSVGRLHRKVTVTAASAPSAAPKKNPDGQANVALPYKVPVMMNAARPPAKLPPRALNA